MTVPNSQNIRKNSEKVQRAYNVGCIPLDPFYITMYKHQVQKQSSRQRSLLGPQVNTWYAHDPDVVWILPENFSLLRNLSSELQKKTNRQKTEMLPFEILSFGLKQSFSNLKCRWIYPPRRIDLESLGVSAAASISINTSRELLCR